MYVRPGHVVAAPAAPPEDQGERLATFPRAQGEELRLSAAEFNGCPYLALRLWRRDRDGGWWPVAGKGISVRIGEVGAMAEALAAFAPKPRDDRPAKASRPGTRPEQPRHQSHPAENVPHGGQTRRRQEAGSSWSPPGPRPGRDGSSLPGFSEV